MSYDKIEKQIDQGDYQGAEIMLHAIQDQDAEWFYMKSRLSYGKGWYQEAFDCLQQARRMEPHNAKYSLALEKMQKTGQDYQSAALDIEGSSEADRKKKKYKYKDNNSSGCCDCYCCDVCCCCSPCDGCDC